MGEIAGFKRTAVAAACAAVTILSAAPQHASAGLIDSTFSAFTSVASPGLITFSEFAVLTQNPSYTPANYGGVTGSPTVNFDGFFTGQSLGTAGTCPVGTSPLTACVIGSPTGPSLSLAGAAAPNTLIVDDNPFTRPTTPVLAGSPAASFPSTSGFNGPIAMIFDIDVAGVGFDVGVLSGSQATKITAFARDGTELGSFLNGVGILSSIEFFGLETDNNVGIAGVLLSTVGNEPAGFGIDNLRFINKPAVVGVPEPTSLALLAIGLVGFALRHRKNG